MESFQNEDDVIAVDKLDGTMMYLNEDLIERVEDGADGKSAVYLINGGHIIVANQSNIVVNKIRVEKETQLRRVFQGLQDDSKPPPHPTPSEVTVLSQVREQ